MTEQTAAPAAPPTPARPPSGAVSRRSWQALIVLLAGMFMALLDTTIVNVALPDDPDEPGRLGVDAVLDHLRLRAGVRPRADPGGPDR